MDKLSTYIIESLDNGGNRPYLKIKRGFFYSSYTYSETKQLIQKTITFLHSHGLEQGDTLLIWAGNSPEWEVLFLAAVLAGIIIVPASTLLSEEIIRKYVDETKPKAIFRSVFQPRLPAGDAVFGMELEDLFTYIRDLEPAEINAQIPEDRILEIVYTSGTTGEPKGVAIIRDSCIRQVNKLRKQIKLDNGMRGISLLPFSHIYEQIVSMMVGMATGGKLFFLSHLTAQTIKVAFAEYKPTHLVLVPEMMKTLADKIRYKFQHYHMEWFLNLIIEVSVILPVKIRRLIFFPMLKQFGGKLVMITLAGAKTDYDVQKLFTSFGIEVIEGYGLTETTGGITMNSPGSNKVGTSGKLLPDLDLKFTEENEILVKGDTLFTGYFKKPEKNPEIFDEMGYFRTGDIGSFDKDGYLVLKGRQKFRIVLSNGEKVYPEDIEYKLRKVPGIKEACVFAYKKDNAEYVAAAVILKNKNDNLDKLMQTANKNLEIAQQIHYYQLWPNEDLPRSSTFKVNRAEVLKVMTDVINENREKNAAGKLSHQFVTSPLEESVYKILSLICGISREKLSGKLNLVKDLQVDSIRKLTILTLLQEELSVNIPDAKINAETDINGLIALIKESPKIRPFNPNHLPWQYHPVISRLRGWWLGHIYLPLMFRLNEFHVIYDKESAFPQGIYVSNHPGTGEDMTFLLGILGKHKLKTCILSSSIHWKGLKGMITGRAERFFAAGIPIDVSGGDIERSLQLTGKLIEKGYSVLMSPQGKPTRSDSDVLEIRDGTSFIVNGCGLPIIPIYMDISWSKQYVFKKKNLEHFKYRFFFRQNKVTIHFGKPYYLPPHIPDKEANKIIGEKILELKPVENV